jgi:DNA-binding XRE family transcriptional regulator
MEENNRTIQTNNLAVPIAIVIAGALTTTAEKIKLAMQKQNAPEPQVTMNPVVVLPTNTQKAPVTNSQRAWTSIKETGKYLRTARYAQGLTQMQVAAKAGLSDSTIARIEKHGWASLHTMAKVADALDLTIMPVPNKIQKNVELEINNL